MEILIFSFIAILIFIAIAVNTNGFSYDKILEMKQESLKKIYQGCKTKEDVIKKRDQLLQKGYDPVQPHQIKWFACNRITEIRENDEMESK